MNDSGPILAVVFLAVFAMLALLVIDWDNKTNPPNQQIIGAYGTIDGRSEYRWQRK